MRHQFLMFAIDQYQVPAAGKSSSSKQYLKRNGIMNARQKNDYASSFSHENCQLIFLSLETPATLILFTLPKENFVVHVCYLVFGVLFLALDI